MHLKSLAALQVVDDSELFHSALVHLRAALNITEKVWPRGLPQPIQLP